MAKLPEFLKEDNQTIFFVGQGELVFYVPEKYFELNRAIINGDLITILGIFDYAVFDKDGKAMSFTTNGKNKKLHNLILPTFFLTKPGSIEKVKGIKLTEYSEVKDYRLLKYKKGDKVICNTKVVSDVNNIESFIMVFLQGNLPNTIPYDKLHEYFLLNGSINGLKYNITAQLLGVIISELCRDQNDLTVPFRLSSMKDMTAYKGINITKVPKYVSPFTSITSENWSDSVTHAVMNTRTGNIKDSPMEKIMIP